MTPEPFEAEIAELDVQFQSIKRRVKELTATRKFDYVITGRVNGKQMYWCRTFDTEGKQVGHFFQVAELTHLRVHRDKTYVSAKAYLDYLIEIKSIRVPAEIIQVPRA